MTPRAPTAPNRTASRHRRAPVPAVVAGLLVLGSVLAGCGDPDGGGGGGYLASQLTQQEPPSAGGR